MKTSVSLLFVALLGILPAWGDAEWDKAEKECTEVERVARRYPTEKFHQAVRDGDVNTVRRLLDSGVPVSLRIPWGDSTGIPPWSQAIHEAGDHPEMMRLLLVRGADPGARDSNRSTPLHFASHPETAKLLLDHGAGVSARNDDGEQPIHCAALGREPEDQVLAVCKLLIQHGANPTAKDADGVQPIHFAALMSNLKVVRFFLGQGASASATTNIKADHGFKGWQPIHYVSSNSGDPLPTDVEVVRLLISQGADTNALTAEGEAPLHLLKGAAVTRLLLDHGAAVNIRDTGTLKDTPLHRFALRGDLESVKLLLEHGANISALDGSDETPLDNAAFYNRQDVVTYLVKKGARPTRNTLAQAERSGETESASIIRARLSSSYLRPAHRR